MRCRSNVVPGLGGALWPVTFVVLQLITNVYYQLAGLNRLLGAPSGRSGRRPAARPAAQDPAAALVSAAARADSGSRPDRTPPGAG